MAKSVQCKYLEVVRFAVAEPEPTSAVVVTAVGVPFVPESVAGFV